MDIITGYVGSPHVTAEQDRDINIGIFGNESYVLQTGSQLTAEVSSNNEIKVRDGVIMHQGCAASIKKNTYDSLTIANGSQGMKRGDLIVARYSRNPSTNVESLKLKVLQGTPSENSPTVPGYTTGDIQSGDLVADMPLYQVILNGLNITEVKKLFSVQESIAELKSNLIDSVIEQGTSGIWTYRKWNSGIAECWGTTTVTTEKWEVWGNLYEGYPKIDPISFPPSLFATNDVSWQVTSNSYMGVVSIENASLITKDNTSLMWVLRPNKSTETSTVRVSMEAKGRWK